MLRSCYFYQVQIQVDGEQSVRHLKHDNLSDSACQHCQICQWSPSVNDPLSTTHREISWDKKSPLEERARNTTPGKPWFIQWTHAGCAVRTEKKLQAVGSWCAWHTLSDMAMT